MKIYVASSWRNVWQPGVVNSLKKLGHEVYDFRHPRAGRDGFHWSEIDQKWQSWTPEEYREALNHPLAKEGFKQDFDAMKWAEAGVLVLPSGRSAHTEAGWLSGARRPVWVVQFTIEEPELMYNIYEGIITSFEELHKQFGI